MNSLRTAVIVIVSTLLAVAACHHHGNQASPASPTPAPSDHTNPDPGDATCTGQPNDNNVCDRHLVQCDGTDSPTPEKNCEQVAAPAEPPQPEGSTAHTLWCCDGA